MIKKFIVLFLIFISYLFFSSTIYSNQFESTITLDNSPEHVVSILGEPDKISYGPTYEVWMYGDDYLHFFQKALHSYSNANTLRVNIAPKIFRHNKWLDLSSKPDHILSLLGTPSKIDRGYTREIWFYGLNEIHLKNNTIMYFSDKDALKFQFQAKQLHSDPLYLKSLTINDLITILGTPTRLKRGLEYDTWWYGNNFVLTRGESVYFVNKKPSSLRDAPPLVVPNRNYNEISKKLRSMIKQQIPNLN